MALNRRRGNNHPESRMGQGHEFSDEFINAFVDGQMIPEERAQVYAQAASDEAFNRRVCELRKIRDLIQLAYRELPKPGRNRAIPSAKATGVAE
jgi:anti-sigma factor RsiW